ncbi:MAG: hypothetical protein ACI9H8_002581, partial [Lysobacterales bacterium]
MSVKENRIEIMHFALSDEQELIVDTVKAF